VEGALGAVASGVVVRPEAVVARGGAVALGVVVRPEAVVARGGAVALGVVVRPEAVVERGGAVVVRPEVVDLVVGALVVVLSSGTKKSCE
jgi:UDP-3-O-[3-hydroxymyristoyl] glucosamine N-acyltransferase